MSASANDPSSPKASGSFALQPIVHRHHRGFKIVMRPLLLSIMAGRHWSQRTGKHQLSNAQRTWSPQSEGFDTLWTPLLSILRLLQFSKVSNLWVRPRDAFNTTRVLGGGSHLRLRSQCCLSHPPIFKILVTSKSLIIRKYRIYGSHWD
jgi:hypothetical protein